MLESCFWTFGCWRIRGCFQLYACLPVAEVTKAFFKCQSLCIHPYFFSSTVTNVKKCIGNSWNCDADHCIPVLRRCPRLAQLLLEHLAEAHVVAVSNVMRTGLRYPRHTLGMATADFGPDKLEIFTRPTPVVMKGTEWAHPEAASVIVLGIGRECPGNATSHHRKLLNRSHQWHRDFAGLRRALTRSMVSQTAQQTWTMALQCHHKTAIVW